MESSMALGTKPPLEVSLDPTLSERDIDLSVVNRARNDFILRYQKSNIGFVLLLVLGLGFALRQHVENSHIYIWTALLFLTYGARYFLCMRFVQSEPELRGKEIWEKLFSVNVIISGAIWGAGAFYIFPEGSKNHQLMLILVIVFLCAGTIVTHSGYKYASIGFAICCSSPVIAKLFLAGETGLSEAGAFVALFLIVMISSGVNLRKTSNKIFLLSMENQKLIEELDT